MTMKMIFAAIVVSATAFAAHVALDDSAMAECQRKHSYDTCFYALNR
jgi:hypothetical protein